VAEPFLKYYLEGLLAGSLGTLLLILMFLYFLRKATKEEQKQRGETAPETGKRDFRKAANESARYFMIAGALSIAAFYSRRRLPALDLSCGPSD